MNTITTIYRGPTARRSARIEARIDGEKASLFMPYSADHTVAQNHAEAARRVAEYWDTPHQFAGGRTLDGGIWVWVALVAGETMLVNATTGTATVGKVRREWCPA